MMKKGEVQIQMGESRVEGDIYDEHFSYQSGGAFNTQNSYGWLSTQLRESLLSYDEEDTAYIWFTDDYPLQMQEQVTANRELTISGNKMCIGNAERKIIDKDIVGALERIIFTPYSHSTFSGMNGFSITKTYFEYLEANEFPYKLMKPLNKKLKDVLKG